jgi:hypothetical protein
MAQDIGVKNYSNIFLSRKLYTPQYYLFNVDENRVEIWLEFNRIE